MFFSCNIIYPEVSRMIMLYDVYESFLLFFYSNLSFFFYSVTKTILSKYIAANVCLIIFATFLFSGLQFVKSKKGHPLLLLDNYTYAFASVAHTKGTNRWICTSRSKCNCKGKVILNLKEEIVIVKADHNHPPHK